MTRNWKAAVLACFLALSGLVGCGPSGPKIYPVSGTVTLDGKPLPEGLIYFKTVQTGALEAFPVKDGEFKGNAQEGERRVEVCVYETKIQDIDGMKGESKQNLIPKRYNLDSTLKATVTAAGPNKFDFAVTSK